ncbi:MAG: FAD binding domain-containing protein [Eubacteriales bacterium]|nr:FAD binding domain-containing protein [Eubacteriales bacterium]
MNFKEIVQPSSLEEAYEYLANHQKAVIIGGGVFLKLQKREAELGIDLSRLPLSYLKEDEKEHHIGSMTTLREIEISSILPQCMVESVRQIGGVGLRNMVTIGGSVCGKYPFSDINTALLSLGARLVFFKKGEISMERFLGENYVLNDILTSIVVPKVEYSTCRYFKHTYTDFSLVNLSVASGENVRIAVGARPGRSVVVPDINTGHTSEELLARIEFKDDIRGSGAYRRHIAEVMLTEILEEGLLWK